MEIGLPVNQNSEYQRISNTLGTIYIFKDKNILFQVNVTHGEQVCRACLALSLHLILHVCYT